MTSNADEKAGAPRPGGGGPTESRVHAFLRVAGPFWSGPDRWRVRGRTLLLLALSVSMVPIAVWTNMWNAALFDALDEKAADKLLALSGIFGMLLTANVLVTAGHLYVKRRLQFGWRRWLSARLIEGWMARGRHFHLHFLPGNHANPDGRIAEDVRITTEEALELAHSLLYSVLLVASFLTILWTLSGEIVLPLAGGLALPGHMVWLALLYSGIGSLLAMRIGRPLVRATDTRQGLEADFRFGLVRADEHAEAIAVMRGEPEERRRLGRLFAAIGEAWRRQTTGLWKLIVFQSGYGMLATAFPILVSLPRYVAGDISLGELVQTSLAFQQATAALSWPVDNSARLAEWRASVERVLALEQAVGGLASGVRPAGTPRIEVEETGGPTLALRGLCATAPDGRPLFAPLDAEVLPGERVRVTGDAQAALTLFKAIAGVWPWGSGRVELPEGATIAFLTPHPYLPIDTLRAVLAYPREPMEFDNSALHRALQRAGLRHLATELDREDAWDQTLGLSEQQRIGFARALLQRPAWVLLEDVTDSFGLLDDRGLYQVLREDLPETTLILVSHRIEPMPEGLRTLILAPPPAPEPAPTAGQPAAAADAPDAA